MKKLTLLKSALVTLGLAFVYFDAVATPWGMPRDAKIEVGNGVPKLCIPAEETNDVAVESVSVSESFKRDGIRQVMWSVEINKISTPVVLKPGDCLGYGVALSGYKIINSSRPLENGVTYYFRLNRRVSNPQRTSVTFYDATFCSAIQGGELRYPQYLYQKNGGVIKPRCDSD
ncbi:hypothetical protein IB274_14550 [Pseudomonas sp. PDM18]|uniref:hypothetical protein n=1 Tax=Pseudomonas sp. PDM18 TaxID=2769253 RepID=UPI00177FCEE9|nr:hypothetical protein [Pseudomonas sp. PDM18]MBD9677930.1 hypothetical protein [Pseudomonas sp. PDM18]